MYGGRPKRFATSGMCESSHEAARIDGARHGSNDEMLARRRLGNRPWWTQATYTDVQGMLQSGQNSTGLMRTETGSQTAHESHRNGGDKQVYIGHAHAWPCPNGTVSELHTRVADGHDPLSALCMIRMDPRVVRKGAARTHDGVEEVLRNCASMVSSSSESSPSLHNNGVLDLGVRRRICATIIRVRAWRIRGFRCGSEHDGADACGCSSWGGGAPQAQFNARRTKRRAIAARNSSGEPWKFDMNGVPEHASLGMCSGVFSQRTGPTRVKLKIK